MTSMEKSTWLQKRGQVHFHMKMDLTPFFLDPFFSLDLTRSSLNTTHRVYFYVIVKMWFTLPINEGRMVFTDRLIAMGARIERLSE